MPSLGLRHMFASADEYGKCLQQVRIVLLKTHVRSDIGSHVELFLAVCQVLVLLPVWFPVGTASPGLPLSSWMCVCGFSLHRVTGQTKCHVPLGHACPVLSWGRAHPAAHLGSTQQQRQIAANIYWWLWPASSFIHQQMF